MKFSKYLIAILLIMTGCISFKSEYPSIDYYRLTQEPSSLKDLKKHNGTLQIRSFSISQDIDTDHFLALTNTNEIKVYYYHRWITDLSSMVTDFFINRFSNQDIFTGGVVGTSTISIPDYIVEAQLLDMIAYNNLTNDPGTNYVTITLKVNLIKYNKLKIDKDVISSQVYTNKTYRSDNSAGSIAPAFSKCISLISDMALADILKSIDKDRMVD